MVLENIRYWWTSFTCWSYWFEHPVTHEYIERHAELPQEFQSLLEDIRLRES